MKKISILNRKFVACCFLAIVFSACKHKPDAAALGRFSQDEIQEWNNKLTQVIIADIFTPAVCSRIYAYTNIAAYEALRQGHTNYHSYAGKLRGLQSMPQPKLGLKYYFPISGVIAFTTVAEKLVFNGDAIKEMEKQYLHQLDSLNVDEELIKNSVSYGREVGNRIVEWAAADGYLQRNSLPAYIVTKEPGRYQPTPPNYIDAVETNWKTLRPFLLDSVSQFRPAPPPKYDTTTNSTFYKEAFEVYSVGKTPGRGDSATAWYWDDNPNTSITDGHITYFQQKNSPPGHWIHIACTIAEKEKYDAIKTASLISKTAIAVADAFISAWEAKFYYNYIRPETFINKYIDKDWIPLIQTPAFPEYPSAHSVASASAATVLTRLVGDKYHFIDSTEVPYGRPIREFNSFYDAADQASISRMYGGIHFRSALEQGKLQGRKIGVFVLSRLK
ncbi:MAG: Vanadium-dependent haloperoxidase [Segetibacter sp.]|nr:Vanadium-dependent haloperoxidase [Segetibacter sp.]